MGLKKVERHFGVKITHKKLFLLGKGVCIILGGGGGSLERVPLYSGVCHRMDVVLMKVTPTHSVHKAEIVSVGKERVWKLPEILFQQSCDGVDVGLECNDLSLEVVSVKGFSQLLHVPQYTCHSVDPNL